MQKEIIQGQDVVRLMMQFCKEHGLSKAFNAMRDETDVKTNFVKCADGLQRAFRNGSWDEVILEVNDMVLPRGLLMDIFELIIFELCEADEYDLCRHLVKDVLVQKSSKVLTKP